VPFSAATADSGTRSVLRRIRVSSRMSTITQYRDGLLIFLLIFGRQLSRQVRLSERAAVTLSRSRTSRPS
jgi:hypothetical protein